MSELTPPNPNPANSQRRLPAWALLALLVLVAVVAVLAGTLNSDKSVEPRSKSTVTYGWQTISCDEWGFEGRLTNRSDQVATFRVWAEVFDDQRRQVDRDSEVVFDLGAGQTETVQFVFSASDFAQCSVAEIEVIG